MHLIVTMSKIYSRNTLRERNSIITLKKSKSNHKETKRTTTKTTRKQAKWQKGTHPSIITLNVNGLNTPTEIHRVVEWVKKQNPSICSPQGVFHS